MAEAAETETPSKKKAKKKDGFWGNVRVILEALAIALFIRTLFFQPFYIPSGSMKPSLLIGDYILINKMSYGYSKYSCPFALCPIGERWFGSEPERGDVAVFSNPGPQNHNKAFVKRVIGLPGDEVQMKESVLYINGEAVPQTPLPDFAEPLSDYLNEGVGNNPFCKSKDENYCYNSQYMETLPNGVEHRILNRVDDWVKDNTDVYVIPEGHFMMIGDNRDNSGDSRFENVVGLVPYKNFIGRASVIAFSSSGSSLLKFWDWRSDRYFKKVE